MSNPSNIRARWIIVGAVACVSGGLLLRRHPVAQTPLAPAEPACTVELDTAPPSNHKITYVWHLGLRVGFPVIEAVVAGCHVRAFLDTGVAGPMLESWFADRLRVVRTRVAARAVDLDLRESPLDAVASVPIDVPDVAVIAMANAVIADDEVLHKYDIAVIAPPQFLVGHEDVTVLDFERATFEKRSHSEAAARVNQRAPTFEASNACDGTFRATITVEGVTASVLVDTGSPISGVYSESAAGRPLAARVTTWDHNAASEFGAGAREEHVAPNVRIAVGDLAGLMWLATWRTTGHVNDARCPFDGLLGTDFFIDRKCVMLFDAGDVVDGGGGLRYTRLRAYCRP